MKSKLILAVLTITVAATALRTVNAQDDITPIGATITGEGINNDVDKKRRAPTVTVGVNKTSGNTQILVDAYIADPEYAEYPIQFDFFVNRKLFTSQIRSKELPGPIGIDVSTSSTPLPFNYTVIATTLHTNRQFKSIVNGAVFSSDLNTSFDCTLTTGVNSDDSIEYIANNTDLTQTGENSLSLNFETNSTPEGHSVKASATITLNGTTDTASLVTETDGEEAKTTSLSGSVEKTDGKITSISLTSEDSDTSLSCS